MVEGLTFHKLTIDNAKSIALLEDRCLGNEAWSFNSISETFDKDYYSFFGAFINEVHVGTVLLTRSFDEADISNVCVDDALRGKGIAYGLLTYAINELMKDGVMHYTLEVRESNKAAIGLYEKAGFVNEGVRPKFYSNPEENAVIMWKHI